MDPRGFRRQKWHRASSPHSSWLQGACRAALQSTEAPDWYPSSGLAHSGPHLDWATLSQRLGPLLWAQSIHLTAGEVQRFGGCPTGPFDSTPPSSTSVPTLIAVLPLNLHRPVIPAKWPGLVLSPDTCLAHMPTGGHQASALPPGNLPNLLSSPSLGSLELLLGFVPEPPNLSLPSALSPSDLLNALLPEKNI